LLSYYSIENTDRNTEGAELLAKAFDLIGKGKFTRVLELAYKIRDLPSTVGARKKLETLLVRADLEIHSKKKNTQRRAGKK